VTGDRLFDMPADGWLSLADRYIVPPLSVLDARQGYWQERKRQWLGLGLVSEEGRADGLTFNIDDWGDGLKGRNGTSVFDPVLCEIVYQWFTAPAGVVLDPFAGGSVRGIVAAKLGRRYVGVDLSSVQVAENQRQALEITPELLPQWVVGDSRRIVELAHGAYDLVFTCPPYGDLERYSDDPDDLSAVDHETFQRSYRQIVTSSLAMLRANRFAVFVVGNYRDKKRGHFRTLVADTIAAAAHAGCDLYNEGILVTPTGTGALRAPKQFDATRKLVSSHQTVLVFVKGDSRAAADYAEERGSV